MREALYAKVDVRLGQLPERKSGDWVTAGGIITQAKKIRTKSGAPMMFATLDDLEGSVEILVFEKTLAELEPQVDDVVLVPREGRPRRQGHGPGGAAGRPLQADRARGREGARRRRTSAVGAGGRRGARRRGGSCPPGSSTSSRTLFGNHQGTLGGPPPARERPTASACCSSDPSFKVDPTPSLRAELNHILRPALVAAPVPGPGAAEVQARRRAPPAKPAPPGTAGDSGPDARAARGRRVRRPAPPGDGGPDARAAGDGDPFAEGEPVAEETSAVAPVTPGPPVPQPQPV